PDDPEPIISTAINCINGQEWDAVDNNRARVMYLDNDLFEHGLYNGSIEIIIELIDEDTVNAVFPAPLRIIT
ncbi:6285_t:CDS:2, partial [Dentiscutata heterogama]